VACNEHVSGKARFGGPSHGCSEHGGILTLFFGRTSRENGHNVPTRLLVLAAAVLLVAATGWNSAATGSAPPTGMQLNAALLRPQDVPPGYGETKLTSSTPAALGCLTSAGLLSPGKPGSSAEVGFSKTITGPFLFEVLVAVKTGTGASTMARVANAFTTCNTFHKRNSDGSTDTYTLTKISFPHLGDDNAAFRIHIQENGTIPLSGEFNFAIVRRADDFLILGQGGVVRSADAALLVSLTQKAYERLNIALH
jgi:hypothetical protein